MNPAGDTFIFHLVSVFTIAIVIWAIFAYTELWVFYNLRISRRILSKLLRAQTHATIQDPPDYIIVQGTYKGRRVVCRLSRFAPSKFLHYDLRLHIHMEPNISMKSKFPRLTSITENTELESDNKISYRCTSSTTIKTYFFASRIPQDEFTNIFQELTRAAEIVGSWTMGGEQGA
jgi:hypothetical protein